MKSLMDIIAKLSQEHSVNAREQTVTPTAPATATRIRTRFLLREEGLFPGIHTMFLR